MLASSLAKVWFSLLYSFILESSILSSAIKACGIREWKHNFVYRTRNSKTACFHRKTLRSGIQRETEGCVDLKLFSSVSEGPLAPLELLSCLWSWLPCQNLLQLHIQLLLFLSGEKESRKLDRWQRKSGWVWYIFLLFAMVQNFC